jgi:SPP1 family predicted phage head-tail adaptor
MPQTSNTLESGNLREWLIFESLTVTSDEFGAGVETWTAAFADWGEYQGLGSREFPLSQKRQAEATARFIIRYREGIDPATFRIRFDGKAWNITTPIHDAKRSYLTIEASEIS